MKFIPSTIPDVTLIEPAVFGDHRGFFLESYSRKPFADAGITAEFIQDNHSCSLEVGILRGLHFQKPPFAQSKLLRVTKGAIYDVVVDLRKASATFGCWRGFELSAKNFAMLFVPAGFAHGFCTIEPDTHVQYKVDALYAPEYDSGIIWNDPNLKITWPVEKPILSAKDAKQPLFSDTESPF